MPSLNPPQLSARKAYPILRKITNSELFPQLLKSTYQPNNNKNQRRNTSNRFLDNNRLCGWIDFVVSKALRCTFTIPGSVLASAEEGIFSIFSRISNLRLFTLANLVIEFICSLYSILEFSFKLSAYSFSWTKNRVPFV